MRQWLFGNLGWKLLSLAIATVLWLIVAREPELATSINVPVEYKNIPDDLDISSGVPDRVYLEVRGSPLRLTRDNLQDAAIVLDLSTVNKAGERTFTVREANLKLPSGVSFYKAVPSQVTLRFERLVSKNVPIRPKFATGPPPGYAIVASSFNPPTARIIGPESRIRSIDSVSTDPIDLSNVVGKTEMRVHLSVGDPQIRLRSETQVHFNVTLEKRDMN